MTPALSNSESLRFFSPELVLSAGSVIVLLLDRLLARSRHRANLAVAITLGVLALAALGTWSSAHATVLLFDGLVVLDPWANFFRCLFWVATALAVVMAAPSREISAARMGEYCALLLAIAVGLSLMTCAADLVTATLGLELVSIVSYALAGFRSRNRASAEAALKYVLYGGVATGLMVFGLS